ncbi:hypothetical protein [Actinocorallia populi]|uniref:hypothetical protein n=1 Tax=Actinocorallia populi TaxID=2079200 RepID=UPI000D0893D3|nr:hypothetical protein [Actinocorallia populi]
MIKEALGAAVLGATLVSAPAAAAPKEEISVRIRVWTEVFGNLSRVRTIVKDEDKEPVEGLRVCLQIRRKGFRTLECAKTDGKGRVTWLADPRKTYRILIPPTRDHEGFRSRAFAADEPADLGRG